MSTDDRVRAFLDDGPEVFRSIEQGYEIWRDNPFDVESVHAEARETLSSLLVEATTPPGPIPGRIALVLGRSGTGKTHLLRAFRAQVHKSRTGFVGYMQMTSSATSYARYILSNLIDSLDQPYDEMVDGRTGLARLAGVLASRAFESKLALLLRDDPDLDDEEVTDLVRTGADRLVSYERYRASDLDLLRALLYLHRPDPRIKGRILKYLRCEALSDHDRARIGDITPRTDVGDPARMIEGIGRLAAVIADNPMSLVICIDQIEDTFLLESSDSLFRNALATVRDLAERVPSSIFVVSCIEDQYDVMKGKLGRSLLDRLERDPAPIRLATGQSTEEARRLVAARLDVLYATAQASVDAADRLFPFRPAFFENRRELRARDILDACRDYRDRCRRAGRLVDQDGVAVHAPIPVVGRTPDIVAWEQRWNDFLAGSDASPPEDDDELAALLAWAVERTGEELDGRRFEATPREGAVRVTLRVGQGTSEQLHVALCNRTAQFGWLARQISQHAKKVEDDPARPIGVFTRNDDFPRAKSVEAELAAALRPGGRKVVIQDADWRAMLALRRFRERHQAEHAFVAWCAHERHLSRLGSIRQILDLEHLSRLDAPSAPPAAPKAERPRAPAILPSLAATEKGLLAGATQGLSQRPIFVTPAELTCHAAFLGGSGSGKTTLALSLIEQLLLAGVPVLMVDRKGDLAGYARPEVWDQPMSDALLDERRRALIAAVDVALFTPGHPEGRPLAITVAPAGLAEMSPFEREETAMQAAQALGDMLGYRHVGRDASLRAILIQALKVLAEQIDRPITLEALIPFIDGADEALVAAVGRLDVKLFSQLVQNLETLKLTATQLFAAGGEVLDIDMLLGTGVHARAGRSRLSIVSTKFLRDDAQVQFWVAQMLFALLRWASRGPAKHLQAVILFDEADLYLPALRQPATKAPMESLLKRGRSAGLGVLLATQSPGDLDYRCRDTIRTWFLGRIKEQTALQKLRPMWGESSGDLGVKLPGQEQGEFHLVREGKVTHLRAQRSVLVTEQLPDTSLLALARRTRDHAQRG
jgi:hypothetical protein